MPDGGLVVKAERAVVLPQLPEIFFFVGYPSSFSVLLFPFLLLRTAALRFRLLPDGCRVERTGFAFQFFFRSVGEEKKREGIYTALLD